MEIPRCESCGRIAQYGCAIDRCAHKKRKAQENGCLGGKEDSQND